MKILFILSLFSSLCFGQKNKIKLDKNIYLIWEIKKFDKKKHSYEYCKNIDTQYLCKIDGKEWFGNDWGIDFPKNQLTKLHITINGKEIPLEISQMYNPNFDDILYDFQFKIKKHKGFYKLYGFFSDGAGAYNVHWKIQNGKSRREIISRDEKYATWQLE